MAETTPELQQALRALPGVDTVLEALDTRIADWNLAPRLVTAKVRAYIEAERQRILARYPSQKSSDEIIQSIADALSVVASQRLRGVINGTGVILHTNLGRSPLSAEAVKRVVGAAGTYSNLEFDLALGKRGSRGSYLEASLACVCGAEAATIVNNCAAGLILVLQELLSPEKCEVIVSRGELVEIGGGFRIPEILETRGAKLREIGTTNRTRAADYIRAIGPESALIMKVHQSNFYQEGFIEEASLEELVSLGKEHEIPVVFDLGSGALFATETQASIPHEPTVNEAIATGADLVCFSGDKLLGGPQAGVIVGKQEMIARLKRNPMFRALRCDKMVIAAMQETVEAYLSEPENPQLAHSEFMRTPIEQLEERAQRITNEVDASQITLGAGASRCGGGTMPKAEIPSITIDIKPKSLSLEAAAEKLRLGRHAVIGYVINDVLKIDLRTVFSYQDSNIVEALNDLIKADA
ncbi:MAG: L-seryl-tRNA(Sec) selenium transferase [Verrucomicrobiota bacterium]